MTSKTLVAALGLASATPAFAQQTPANVDASAPSPLPNVAPPPTTTAPEVIVPETKPSAKVNSGSDLPAPAAPPAKLTAPHVYSQGNLVIAEGTPEQPVRLETSTGKIEAQRVEIDTEAQTVKASGRVIWQRQRAVRRKEMRARSLRDRYYTEQFQESATGENLQYNYKSAQGHLDNAEVVLSGFTIQASAFEINGKRYTAHNVIVIPGGMTPEERKIYGTPPLTLHAKTVTATSGNDPKDETLVAKGAGLYLGKSKILPVPSFVTRAVSGGGPSKEPSDPTITPMLGYNSSDGLLVTTKLRFPLAKDGKTLSALADIGLSQRIGLRGGATLEHRSNLGRFNLSLRHSDIVTTQLTNRIELDREPEFTYRSRDFATFALPGDRRGGFRLFAGIGEFSERTVGTDSNRVDSRRTTAGVSFTTRITPKDGPFLELFATDSDYSKFSDDYRNMGFEVGYEGTLFDRIRGQVSYRSNSLEGDTPFRFDRVEIARELRTTFDVTLTPRYIVPIDLRYDLSRHAFRDKTFGLLRSYKTFAYGVVYQQARRDLRLEIREGF